MHTQVLGYIYSLGAVLPTNLLLPMPSPGFEAMDEHPLLPDNALAHCEEGGGRCKGPTLLLNFETTSPDAKGQESITT